MKSSLAMCTVLAFLEVVTVGPLDAQDDTITLLRKIQVGLDGIGNRVQQLETNQTSSPEAIRRIEALETELSRLRREFEDSSRLFRDRADAEKVTRQLEQLGSALNRHRGITNSIGMKLAFIPAGEFLMGFPDSVNDAGSDKPQHRVQITRPFYLGVYEVTQAEYQRC